MARTNRISVWLGGLLSSASVLLGASPAHADGGIPRAHQILFEPGNPDSILIRSDFWGLFRSKDGGQTWQYGCAELFGGSSKQGIRKATVLLPGGRILVGVFSGIRMSDDLCNWTDNESIKNHIVEDVVLQGTDVYAVAADGLNGGIVTTVWKSSDKGSTWTATPWTFPANYAGGSLAFAPSDPKRVYVGGAAVDDTHALVAYSADGGGTWNVSQVTVPSTSSFETRVKAVHPTRPEVAFLWLDMTAAPGTTVADEIWGTSDGGATWVKVYAGKDDLPGLALSPDGSRILIAGKDDRLQGADVDQALSQGQAAFQTVFDGQVWGLTWTSDALYAGNNNFTERGIPAFSLGRSTDEGKSFTPLMNVCQLEFATCDPGSTMEAACQTPWSGSGGYVIDYLESSRCKPVSDAGADGGKGGGSGSDDSGCSVGRTPRNGRRAASLAVMAFAGAGLLRRRRRRH